jgi:hypothetical protein
VVMTVMMMPTVKVEIETQFRVVAVVRAVTDPDPMMVMPSPAAGWSRRVMSDASIRRERADRQACRPLRLGQGMHLSQFELTSANSLC